MKFTVLGCGDAFGSKGRYNTSFLLGSENEKVLVDCGATTLVRLKQLKIEIDQINTIIITHFHGDHYGGIPFLILSRYFEYEHRPLTIIGPKGLEEKVHTLQEVLYPGTTNHFDSLDVTFIEYTAKETLQQGDITIHAREVTHSPPSNPHGVKLHWKGKTFAFSGDTSWNDSLIDLADGADLFVIECNNFENQTSGHLSYKEILEKKKQFNTKRLYLTHMGSEVINQRELEIDRLSDGKEIDF